MDAELLPARINDTEKLCEQTCTPKFLGFLTQAEAALARNILKNARVRADFFGGYDGAERVMLGCFPDWAEDFPYPISPLTVSFRRADVLSHRDILGSLMALGIKRETVGDIYVGEGSCDFLVLREILPYVLQNLVSAGRTKLHLEEIELSGLHVPQQSVKTVRDTVPSLRLDGIVSSGFSISRGKAADYIAAGKAELNYLPCMKGDKQVQAGDVISVRGLGKIKLETIGGNTKKGRISIEISRFL